MAFAYTGKGMSGSGTDKRKHVTAMPIKDSRVCLRQPPSPRETLGGGGALSDNPKNNCESAWWLAGCLEFDHIWEVLISWKGTRSIFTTSFLHIGP